MLPSESLAEHRCPGHLRIYDLCAVRCAYHAERTHGLGLDAPTTVIIHSMPNKSELVLERRRENTTGQAETRSPCHHVGG
jgi:hypothetical protein